ncbi:hypothetical protein [Reichenbachiella sp. MALMAid0571]|uniref:hypothetical protein n=1 Tax=Reichenbachiella sp. MALMAid0571 TaxID=3143939 RepID=UPI0032DE8CF3
MKSLIKNSTLKVLAILILSLLSGCALPSINPIYYQSDVLFEDRLIGQWDGVQSIWTFEKGSNNSYLLTYWEGENLQDYSSCTFAEFEVHLLKLDNDYFIDFYPDNFMNSENLFLQFHIRRTHSFARITFKDENNLSIQFPDYMWFADLLEERPGLIDHIRTEDGVILTDETHHIQRFIKEFATSNEAFIKPYTLRRAKKDLQ